MAFCWNLANRSYLLQIIVIFLMVVILGSAGIVSTVLIYRHVLKHHPEELHKFPLLSNPDLVVAQDGSGNFTTVSAAVAAAPSRSKKLFVIYIKAGVYTETVKVATEKTNLACIGDGIDKTIVTFNGTTAEGFESGETATLNIRGNGFMAVNLTIANSAIALRTAADKLTFYRCSIKGHMYTLSAMWGKQFFRDCDIYGTTSIISGAATAVFQNCNIIALEPSPGQKVVLFVQGRKAISIRSGFVFQSCNISAGYRVRSTAEAYLGQPLEALSRVVIMQSYIDRLISPAGWLGPPEYSYINTAYLGEYENKGPGADTRRRVSWPAFRVLSSSEAKRFTLSQFFKGTEWLHGRRVPYISSLM